MKKHGETLQHSGETLSNHTKHWRTTLLSKKTSVFEQLPPLVALNSSRLVLRTRWPVGVGAVDGWHIFVASSIKSSDTVDRALRTVLWRDLACLGGFGRPTSVFMRLSGSGSLGLQELVMGASPKVAS